MRLSVHAIEGSASAPTAQHQRRRPRTAGDRAGKQDRQFIGALAQRFRHFSGLFLHFVAWHGRKTRPKPRPCHRPREQRRASSLSVGDDWRSTAQSGETTTGRETVIDGGGGGCRWSFTPAS
jgi:hypothetical protein